MITYLKKTELKASLNAFVEQSIKEAVKNGKLSQEFITLIKHNFLAKFVYYNKQKNTIEVGVNESTRPSFYPTIKVYSYPVGEAGKWLNETFKETDGDLEFYGEILNKSEGFGSSQVVLF